MQTGKQINASEINSWKSGGYDLWRTHTHTASDRTGIDTFGNLTVYGAGGTTVTASTGAPQSNTQPPFSPIAGITPGGEITATDINGMILIANNMRVHSHVITDAVGGTAPAVVLTPATFTNFQYTSNTVETLTFDNTGTLSDTAAGVVAGQWINMRPVDLATASSYDIFVTHTGGPAPTGSALSTWLNLGTTRSWSTQVIYVGGFSQVTTNITVQIRNASTLAVVATAAMVLVAQTDDVPPPPTCFPAGSQVLMADGTWKAIQNVQAGDTVMGMGHPVTITEMDRPILGNRKMMRFADNSLRWSEEHAMWTRDQSQSQWWWTANRKMWTREANMGAIGGLTDNESIRTGDQAIEWAHISGWKANEAVVVESQPSFNTRLYLPRTNGSPIIVNGYVVGAGVNQAGYDYATLDWTAVQASFPVVQPMPPV
jgi:hypothetical protein